MERKSYFNKNNKEIIEAIVEDDSDTLSAIISENEESLNQEFGFDHYFLPAFLSSAPPILSVAAYFHAENCVDFLIDCGADVNKLDLIGRNIIHFAIAGGSMRLVRMFDQQCNVQFDKPDKNGNGPIHVACEYGFIDIVQYIYTRTPAELTRKNNVGMCSILIASYYGNLEIIKFLKQVGVNIREVDSKGLSALHFACAGGHADVASYLIQEGIDVDKTGHDSDTPILLACENGSLETVKVLVEAGSKKFKVGNAKHSPIIVAAANGHVDVIKYLVSKGSNVDISQSNGETPITAACDNNQFHVVKWLIKNGAHGSKQALNRVLNNYNIDFDMFKTVVEMTTPTISQNDRLIVRFIQQVANYYIYKNKETRRYYWGMGDKSYLKHINYMLDNNFAISKRELNHRNTSKQISELPDDVKDKFRKIGWEEK